MGQTQSTPTSHRRSSSSTSRNGRGEEIGARNRALAKKEALLRRELSQKSQTAWAQNDKAKAKEYSNASKVHQLAMESYNALAAAEIFRAHNPTYDQHKQPPRPFLLQLFSGPLGGAAAARAALAQIDLHGLHVTEALPLVREHLRLCRRNGVARTTIITGRGLHSVDGIAKIRPQVERMLAEERVKVVREGAPGRNEGAFVVELAAEGEAAAEEDEVVGWVGWVLAGLFGGGGGGGGGRSGVRL